ncbi:MAG TPA: Lrp/AsnC family transcriptional regulator [Dehalococcoidia bacterium]|nr:Lrp/AsnC family transcriptional regulator [Dehalococcoidia bacterium]
MNKEVLKVLENDARATAGQISTMTGLSARQVRKTIEEAEDDRIIVKYKTVINWEKLGEERVYALVEVKTHPQKDVGFEAIAERIYRFPEASSVYLVSGAYDLAVLVVARTEQEIGNFVSQKLASLDSVEGTVTHFFLKRYKEDGEILVGEEKVPREPLTL